MTTNKPDGDVAVPTPRHGRLAVFLTRTDTNDGALVLGIIANDEYRLGHLPELSGVAVDIGAHIGTVSVSLALDHPALRVIAVEAVPENVEVLRLNVAHNGLDDRITVIEGAAAEPGRKSVTMFWNYTEAPNVDDAYLVDSRYIANLLSPRDSVAERHRVKAIDLDRLVDMAGGHVALLKIDCEGCEWQFLRSEALANVGLIIGEYHNLGGLEALRSLVAKTHTVTQTGGLDDIGMFWATPR